MSFKNLTDEQKEECLAEFQKMLSHIRLLLDKLEDGIKSEDKAFQDASMTCAAHFIEMYGDFFTKMVKIEENQ